METAHENIVPKHFLSVAEETVPNGLHFPMQKRYEMLFSDSGCFFPRGLETSHFINLCLKMVFQYLESTLYTLVVATSDKLSGYQEQPLLKWYA